MKSLLHSFLGLARSDQPTSTSDALRALLEALDRLEPLHAKYLARFAYLLGRIAHADQHVSTEETQVMERLVAREGDIPTDQAMLVVGLAKTSNLLFGGTDNFIVARDFAAEATHEQKLALLRCVFALSAAEDSISIAEEREIQKLARELKIEHAEVVKLRLEYRQHLPGLSDRSQ